MATNCWSWHGVTAAAWSLVFIHWIFCDHDAASVHIVTDNQRHSHRRDVSTFPLFCLLVGWFEIQNTCFLCLCDVADFFFKGFQYIQDVKRMGLFISLCHFIECDWVISRRGPIRWDAGVCILFARPQQICERCLLMLENELLRRPTDIKSLLIHYCKMVLKQVVSKIGTFVQTDNFVR